MATFTDTFTDDGAREKRLTFRGKDYIYRTSPVVEGLVHGLDRDLDTQVEDDYPDSEELLQLVYGLETGYDDGQIVLPRLTVLEAVLQDGENGR